MAKVMTEDGVRRLWAAIEAKFIDTTEIESFLAEITPGVEMVPMSNIDIDNITGYVEPQENDNENEEGNN